MFDFLKGFNTLSFINLIINNMCFKTKAKLLKVINLLFKLLEISDFLFIVCQLIKRLIIITMCFKTKAKLLKIIDFLFIVYQFIKSSLTLSFQVNSQIDYPNIHNCLKPQFFYLKAFDIVNYFSIHRHSPQNY